jgi:bidirectional [NiFe] hydrogenase diaphorase subunit
MQVKIRIDEQEIQTEAGEKLLWAALDQGVYIPHLCALKEAERPAASCRLCFVEVDGLPHPVTACTTPVVEGMSVKTRSPKIDRLVRTAFELLLSNHHLRCGKCPQNRRCERGLKLKLSRLRPELIETTLDESLGSIIYDPNRCVLCGRCVQIDHCRVKVGAIGFIKRGIERKVAAFGDTCWVESPCTKCGECVRACPTGALSFRDDWPKKAESGS